MCIPQGMGGTRCLEDAVELGVLEGPPESILENLEGWGAGRTSLEEREMGLDGDGGVVGVLD
jgi:hypothetical protein